MKYIFGRMVISFFLLLFFWGIGASAATTSDSCRVKKGKPFVVKMPSNPTTGYSWRWNKDRSVANVDSVSHQYVAKKSNAIGSGGLEIWTFKSNKRGIYYLQFEYSRSWEKKQPIDIRVVKVFVF